MVLDRVHPFGVAVRQERNCHHNQQANGRDIQKPALDAAQRHYAQQSDAHKPGPGLSSDGNQQAGKDQCSGKQRDQLSFGKNRAIFCQPDDQRDDRNGYCRQGAALIKAEVVVHKKFEHAIAAATDCGLDPAADDDGPGRQNHDQRGRFDSQPRAQGKRQKNGKNQSLPHPIPFQGGFDREIGTDRGYAAIDQQDQQQDLTKAKVRALLAIDKQPANKRCEKYDQRYRQGGEQRPGNLLRRQNVDIEIGQNPQERPPDAKREESDKKSG